MRKLSKKISMLMVLAMLVGLFSGVVSASAASAWSFASSKYDVAVNGSINMESKEYADFDLLKDGKAPAGYTVAWASSDEDVVWVNAKTGQLRANKFGKAADGDKAVISATFTNTATKKSATRSFTIVLGAAKADFTVEAADVTIALGEEVKFAPVVKDAAGNVVKFATHKSYNGYFLDGKAIANPWTPEEAGEYTVTVAQFAKKADVADLAKAVRKDEVKVTVTVDTAFDAKATGLKEITVYGNFAADAKFTVKKNGNQNVAVTVTVAADGQSAKLALNNRLTKAVYTVAYGDAKVDLAVEDEKVASIIIKEKDGQIFTDGSKKYAYVHYDVLNQYGESVRKTFDVSWSVSTSGGIDDNDRTNGILTIAANKEDDFNYNDMVVLTGVASGVGYAASETASMTIGLERNASSVKVLGIVKEGSDELIQEIPASFIGGKYFLVFEMYDRAGYVMEYDYETAKSNLTFTSLNPLLISEVLDEAAVDSVTINGVEYGKVQVKEGLQVRNGGVSEIRITSTKTGETTSYALRVVSEQILDEFRIIAPDAIIATNNQWNGASDVEIAFEAIDNTGANITDFRALYKAVSFSSNSVELREQNDGTAKLFYTVSGDVKPTKDYDYPVVFTAIVPGSGKSSNVTLNVKLARYANSITQMVAQDFSEYILEGNTIAIDLVGNSYSGKALRFEFADQYETKVETRDLFTTGESKYLAAKVVGGSTDITIGGAVVDDVENDDDYILIDPTKNNVTLTAETDVTDGIKAVAVEFAIADKDGKILSGSDKRFTFYVVNINSCVGFSVAPNDGLIQNKANTATFSVKATLANGKVLAVPHTVAGDYTIEYAAEIPGVDTVAAVSGDTINVAPQFTVDEKTNTNLFKDQSSKDANGNYADRKLTYNVTAKIIVDGNLKDVAKTTVEVGNYERKITTINMNQWSLDGQAGSWIKFSSDAYVRATNGVITYDVFRKFIDNKVDNYGDTTWGNNSGVTITITKLAEGGKGLTSGNLVLSANALVDAGAKAMISNAEIGDTFVATYTMQNATSVINFTVGADTTAKFTEIKDLTWR